MDNGYQTDREMAERLAARVCEMGGRAYLVGGCVRDRLSDLPGKDLDIEIHGLTPKQVEEILDSLGFRISVGESFGIYTLKGYGLDIAMPRKETATGRGHRDLAVSVDPFLGEEKAAHRRDFTVNAMMQNLHTGDVLDFFGGKDDLKNGILRAVDERTFPEDPLRVLRGAQFAARLGFTVSPETAELCKTVDLSALSKERVEGELKKALLKAPRPSVFFETLRRMEALDVWFPEVKALMGVKQDPVHHPEGDVWNHTMQTLDNAAVLRDKVAAPYPFMLSALTHDFGKVLCTEEMNGRIHAYEHEVKGQPLVRQFMTRLTNEAAGRRYVEELTRLHMQPGIAANVRPAVKTTNRMFDRTRFPEDLLYLSAADSNCLPGFPGYDTRFAFLWQRLDVYQETMSRPFVSGKDLLEQGLTPGETFSKLLAYAHKLRLAGVEKSLALKQTLSYAHTLEKKK